MDVNRLRERRKKLECDIVSAISGLIRDFQTDTGLSPDY